LCDWWCSDGAQQSLRDTRNSVPHCGLSTKSCAGVFAFHNDLRRTLGVPVAEQNRTVLNNVSLSTRVNKWGGGGRNAHGGGGGVSDPRITTLSARLVYPTWRRRGALEPSLGASNPRHPKIPSPINAALAHCIEAFPRGVRHLRRRGADLRGAHRGAVRAHRARVPLPPPPHAPARHLRCPPRYSSTMSKQSGTAHVYAFHRRRLIAPASSPRKQRKGVCTIISI